jgi:hypothetical protein
LADKEGAEPEIGIPLNVNAAGISCNQELMVARQLELNPTVFGCFIERLC